MEIVKQHDKTNQEMNYVRKIKQDDYSFGVATQKYHIKNSTVPAFTDDATVPFDSNQEDLKAKIDSLMENFVGGEKAWKCKVCGKEAKRRTDIARHVETHIEGVFYPCNLCDAVKRSSNSLNAHVSRALKK